MYVYMATAAYINYVGDEGEQGELWAPLNSFGNFDGQQNAYKASKLAIMEI